MREGDWTRFSSASESAGDTLHCVRSDAFFLISPGTFALFNPLGGWAGIEICQVARAAFQLDASDLAHSAHREHPDRRIVSA